MSSDRRLLLTTDAVGGVWTYSVELAQALEPLGVKTILAVLGPSPRPEQAREVADVPVIDTGLPLDWTAEQPSAIRKAGSALAELADMHHVDIIQLHSAALLADLRLPRPVITVQHSCVASWWSAVRSDPLPSDFSWRRELVENGLNQADAVVAPTAAFAAETARVYGLSRAIHAVHNGRTPIPLPKRSRGDFVFTCGRLWDEGKNLRTLDEAAEQLSIPVEAAGPLSGPNGATLRSDHLRTPGELGAAAIAARLSARPIFASAALYEPFGLSALEAAQAGCALVLSDIPTFRELWDGAALFAPARDAEAFAAAIGELTSDPEKRERLGRAAQLKALQYTPSAMARRMLAIYEQVAPHAARRSASMQMAAAE